MNDDQKIEDLKKKLELLLNRQQQFSKEIQDLRRELSNFGETRASSTAPTSPPQQSTPPIKTAPVSTEPTDIPDPQRSPPKAEKQVYRTATQKPNTAPDRSKTDIEKFIGENLINKVGIIITVIGVAIGAKYSIEHDLISPLTRMVLGYLVGIALLGIGLKLKPKYENYSAVLVSGAIAIMYFITYAAYSFYDLIPQILAFALMVVFTAFTVVAAVNYNKQVIAIIGAVGAYAVPFLVSNDSGRAEILFSYMAIINVGILIISFWRNWKPLYYSSFGLTWAIYLLWYFSDYSFDTHFEIALIFSAVFFVIFYMTILAYKLIKKEILGIADIFLLLLNSFIFYGIWYAILEDHETGEQLLGLFSLGNAILHFVVSVIIFKQRSVDKNLLHLISGLVLVFITIAIPVQLEGNWVTLLWAFEAALLFWIGRTKNVRIYETLSYPLMVLAFFSILQDWSTVYGGYLTEAPETRITPLFNINFLTSVLFAVSFGFIQWISTKHPAAFKNWLIKSMSISIPAILLFVIYYAFRIEIDTFWDQLFADSSISLDADDTGYSRDYYNYDLRNFGSIWIINYSLLFFSALAITNYFKWKDRNLGITLIVLLSFSIGVFLTQGNYLLTELRENYLTQHLSEFYTVSAFNVSIRYVCLAFVSLAVYVSYRYVSPLVLAGVAKILFEFLFHISVLWMLSSELINWMDLYDVQGPFRLGLSILWGLYALFLITLGIWKKKKHLRLGAIVLFGVILLKLFFYDLSDLNTIAKTVVFLSLGALLLIISFLYNKYKHIISNEVED